MWQWRPCCKCDCVATALLRRRRSVVAALWLWCYSERVDCNGDCNGNGDSSAAVMVTPVGCSEKSCCSCCERCCFDIPWYLPCCVLSCSVEYITSAASTDQGTAPELILETSGSVQPPIPRFRSLVITAAKMQTKTQRTVQDAQGIATKQSKITKDGLRSLSTRNIAR